MSEHKVVELPDAKRCRLVGKGSFGQVVALRLGTDSKLYAVSAQGPASSASLAELPPECVTPCTCAFAKPVLKFATSPDSDESLRREIDIHHRINLSHQCTRSHLIQGMPVCTVPSILDECLRDDSGTALSSVDKDAALRSTGSRASAVPLPNITTSFPLNSLIMPRMDSNLHRYLAWRTENPTHEALEEAAVLINEVRSGLKQLHNMKIIHADLSSGNVLISMNPFNEFKALSVCISDFGNCRFLGSEMKHFDISEYVFYLHPDQFSAYAGGELGHRKQTADASQRRYLVLGTCRSNKPPPHTECGGGGGVGRRTYNKDARKPVIMQPGAPLSTSPPRAGVRFDAWSYAIMALDMLMRFCHRIDRNIDAWSRENKGINVYTFVTERQDELVMRIKHVVDVFSALCSKGDTEMSRQIRSAWLHIIHGGLCLSSPNEASCKSSEVTLPAINSYTISTRTRGRV